MWIFFIGLAFLVLAHFTYGKWLVRVLGPDDRKTPAYTRTDGVDYVPLPAWKNMFIQLLNIAGVGPVIGVILGIKFGACCFWIIPLGCVFGGAVHDLVAGFLSVRGRGANLPALTAGAFGSSYTQLYTVFVMFLLLLVVAVFVNIPANLLDAILPGNLFWVCAGAISIYYVVATLFPVDKIIGRVYPFFGAMLLVGTGAMLVMLCVRLAGQPDLLVESAAFKAGKFQDQPIIPCLFVTIACGIMSGFHATQSPIVARTMKNERQVHAIYYGMMIAEGLIAMVWAGVGMAIYNMMPELMAQKPTVALVVSTKEFLGSWMGMVTIVSVVILAVTSGDTALRSLRLTLAESLHMPQTKLRSRMMLCLPLIAAAGSILWWSNLSTESFDYLWKYFAWGNQVLAANTLMMCSVRMMRRGQSPWFTLVPGIFITFVVATFILWSDPKHAGCPYGLGLPLREAYAVAGVFTFFCTIVVLRLGESAARHHHKKSHISIR